MKYHFLLRFCGALFSLFTEHRFLSEKVSVLTYNHF